MLRERFLLLFLLLVPLLAACAGPVATTATSTRLPASTATNTPPAVTLSAVQMTGTYVFSGIPTREPTSPPRPTLTDIPPPPLLDHTFQPEEILIELYSIPFSQLAPSREKPEFYNPNFILFANGDLYISRIKFGGAPRIKPFLLNVKLSRQEICQIFYTIEYNGLFEFGEGGSYFVGGWHHSTEYLSINGWQTFERPLYGLADYSVCDEYSCKPGLFPNSLRNTFLLLNYFDHPDLQRYTPTKLLAWIQFGENRDKKPWPLSVTPLEYLYTHHNSEILTHPNLIEGFMVDRWIKEVSNGYYHENGTIYSVRYMPLNPYAVLLRRDSADNPPANFSLPPSELPESISCYASDGVLPIPEPQR